MLSSLLLLVSFANAQDFKNLQTGQPAPFDGTLLRPEALATIITKNEAEVALCKAESEHKLKEQTINCELDTEKLQYDFDSYRQTNEALMAEKSKELDKVYEIVKKQTANKTPFWISVGFAAGFATSLGTIYVYNNL
jgi:5-deoxy-D-glucuronate isomerase